MAVKVAVQDLKNQAKPINTSAEVAQVGTISANGEKDIGEMKIKISGCINACGHHHVGHLGILGVEKKGVEFYQILLGGSADENTSIGEILGRGFSYEEIVDAVETVVDTYLKLRQSTDESFLAAHRRLGSEPFKEALYATV
jgi:sulfite reductase (NADPH) hemoprotein beta-component